MTSHTTLSRRAVLRAMAASGGAAVAVPTVLSRPVGAQVLASADCTPDVLDWDTFDVGTGFSNAVIEGTTVSISTSLLGSTDVLADNLTIQNGPHGGVNQRFLKLNQVPDRTGVNVGQIVTISFAPQVWNVRFTLTDIDNLQNGWGDRVRMNQAGFTSSTPTGSNVIGAGTTNNPFRNSATNTNYSDNSPGGNVDLTFAGPIGSLSFRYYNQSNEGGANQRIGISDITFEPCAPVAPGNVAPAAAAKSAENGDDEPETLVQTPAIPGFTPAD